ncbi:endoplasmic reticulum chaperone BiP [Acrasis kona]|uniref:Endoplasmic reticulum chaperone BiP n=1 Tax=Acrasis kona TaxID=1008807 RepID=A0AAW2Z0I6_9EUKA
MKAAIVLTLLLALIASTLSYDGVGSKAKEVILTKTNSTYDTPVIGIDLGTTYSVVAIYDKDAGVVIIPNEQGNRITPSVVSFTESGERLIGEAAKNNAQFNPKNTLYDVKRLIGRRYNEVLKRDAKLLTYDLTNKDGRVYVKVNTGVNGEDEQVLSPEEVSAMVLTRMKQIAEKHLGTEVRHAVITVPAYFNDQQRTATEDAGKIAGLNVLRIVNEPTAASMAYGLFKKDKEENVLVFDLGGGTFDVSLLTIDRGVFEVIATSGDTHLGGEDFDLRFVEDVAKNFLKKNKDIKKNFETDLRAFQRLKLACEQAKRTLSYQEETVIELDSLLEGVDMSEKVTRAQFERLNNDLFKKTLIPVDRVLKDSGLSKNDIDEVVLVGGSTRIPKVRELLKKHFDGKELKTDVNPDEAIAYGAAVQAGVLCGLVPDVVLIDVTPLSLGIETVGGVMATIIPRNTPVPTEKSDVFTTTEDYQTRLSIPIYEGERRITKYNRKLGELDLTGIPPAPRGVPQIKVTFKLDQNGILKVIAEDQATKNKQEVEIKKGTLSAEEIEQMQQDAKKNSEEDALFLEKSQAKQKLEQYIESVKSGLSNKNVANRLKSKDKTTVINALKSSLQWMKKSVDRVTVGKQQFEDQLKKLRRTINPIMNSVHGGFGGDELDLDDADPSEAYKIDDDDVPTSTDDDDKPFDSDEL